jgi:SAM-dependent methyltransferase
MTTQETFQIPVEIAEAYEAKFVPSVFAEWAPLVLDAAEVGAGTRLLDVACGTGIVARTAADRVGPEGAVVGVDLNEAMLTVARRIAPGIDWRRGDVAALPVEDDAFDAVTCQMAMMFFPDRRAAFAELCRAVRPDGRVAVVVPASLDTQPAYRVFVDVAVRHAGSQAASLLGTYWNCGDLAALTAAAAEAGLAVVAARTRVGTARFDSCDDFVATEIEASPLLERIEAATYARIKDGARTALARYSTDDGFAVPLVCHVMATRPAVRAARDSAPASYPPHG